MTSISLTGVATSSVAWGDYDNDGDLDILLTGDTGSEPVSKIYRNNGDNTFTEQTSIALHGVGSSSVAWGDYDNDGDLDILLTGSSSSGYVSKIYRNNGENTFTEQTGISLTGVHNGSAEWGDYDNDGDLDILLTGNTVDLEESKIYRNNGDNTFTKQTSIFLRGVSNSSVAWGDYDNDGNLDILLTGISNSVSKFTSLYRNNVNNTFTIVPAYLFPVGNSSVAWGDYDNDGDLDILMTGTSIDNDPESKIYSNNGDNTFTEQAGISLTGVATSSVAWGDYDNDGDLDIILTGNTGWVNQTLPISIIYCNNGDNTFTEQTTTLAGVQNSSVAWGDYDNDGDLDILLTGFSSSGPVSKIYRNNNLTLNTLPTAPTNLSSIVTLDSVTLSWDKSTDNETPQNGLKYNLVIGTSPEAVNTLSPMSDRNTGYRRVINLGNTNHRNSWTIKRLEVGTFYWSVQAIDNNFAGSNFAPTKSFIFWEPFTEMTSIPLAGVFRSSVAWGDYDNDGDLDILLTGDKLNEFISKIYRNNGDNLFTEQTSIFLPLVYWGSVAWGDYDNDGDLDILLTGNKGGPLVSKIYRNNGDNTFTEQVGISLTGVYQSSIAWGDYDNDGDLDILLTGMTESHVPVSKIYRNNGDNSFTEQDGISLTGVFYSSVAWGDYDNDGDLDILLTGGLWSGYVSKIYRNNGDNTFSEQTGISLIGVTDGSAAWGDYDNDGDLDILLTGIPESHVPVSKIYRNDGTNSFVEQTSIYLTGVSDGSSAAWGDYDNDGDLDILLTGSSSADTVFQIYRNNGDNTFSEQTGISFTGVYASSAAWGDYDNDGDLDILLTGDTGGFASISKIYRNNNLTQNTLPAVPSNLSAVINGEDVTLSWDKSTDNETPQNGLRYNLVIGTAPNAVNTLSPMSDRSTGYRRVIELGNTNHNNSWTIKGLDSAQTYYWSVQALDNCFAASGFAQEHSLNITSIEEEQFNGLPTEYELNQNYPNPFNPITVISWQSPVSSWQTMKVYDVLGNEVATLVNEYKPAGIYEIYFNGSGLTSGIYFYKISSGSFVETKKMILLK
jgi:predicted nucleotidyltransferase